MAVGTLNATVVATYPVTARVRQLLLRVDDDTFSHQPGQHVSVRYQPDGESPIYWPYSPVTGPGTDTIALPVKRYDEGTVSVWLHERAVGDQITLPRPSGNLKVRDLDRDVLFLATGTGLTPMLSMLDHLVADRDNLDVRYVLSNPSSRWTGPTGYVQEHLDEPHVYVCGVPEMVVATVDRLQNEGLSADQILTEGWEEGAVDDSSKA